MAVGDDNEQPGLFREAKHKREQAEEQQIALAAEKGTLCTHRFEQRHEIADEEDPEQTVFHHTKRPRRHERHDRKKRIRKKNDDCRAAYSAHIRACGRKYEQVGDALDAYKRENTGHPVACDLVAHPAKRAVDHCGEYWVMIHKPRIGERLFVDIRPRDDGDRMILGVYLEYLIVSVPICRAGEIRNEPWQPKNAHDRGENDDTLARPTRCDAGEQACYTTCAVLEFEDESEEEVAHNEQAYKNEREQKYERDG